MKAILSTVLALVLLVSLVAPAQAQLDPGNHDVKQGGRIVAQIYVPSRPAGATIYVEHWVLFDSYVYPDGSRTAVPTEIVPSASTYTSERDFFARVPWSTGSRYVRVDSQEFSSLPSH